MYNDSKRKKAYNRTSKHTNDEHKRATKCWRGDKRSKERLGWGQLVRPVIPSPLNVPAIPTWPCFNSLDSPHSSNIYYIPQSKAFPSPRVYTSRRGRHIVIASRLKMQTRFTSLHIPTVQQNTTGQRATIRSRHGDVTSCSVVQ